MSRGPALAAGATFLYAIFLFGRYFGPAYQPGIVAALQLAVILLLATGAGRMLLGWLGVVDVSESQRTLIGATLGLGALSLGGFALCAARLAHPAAALVFLGTLWVAGAMQLRAVVVSLGANHALLRERPLSAAAVPLLLGLAFWATLVPPHQYDSLVYHLALPAAYIRSHGFVTVPTLVYSHFPQNAEMLYLLALLLRSDLLAQMFMWLAGALSVCWVFEFGKREAPLSAVLLACLLLAANTAFLLLSSITYVEALVMLWTTAALFSFMRWRQLDAAASETRGWLILSACFTGLALGTKYYAGTTAVLLGSWLLGRWASARSDGQRRRFMDLAVFTGVTTLLFSPWLIKNWLMAGNPFFPFFNSWFAGSHEGWNSAVAAGYFGTLNEYRGLGDWKALSRLPMLLLVNDPRFGGGMDVLGTLGWDILFWSLPAAVWAGWRNRFFRGLLVFCAVYGACWLLTGVVLRFLLVLAPALSLLVANGLYALRLRLGPLGRGLLAAGVALLLACHVLLFFFVELGVYSAGDVLLGLKDRGQYLSSRLEYYPCARYAAEHSGKSDKILLVGEQRGYYLDRDHVATSVHAPNAFIAWANEASSSKELAGRMSAAGFTKMVFVPRELKRLGEGVGDFTERGAANWAGLEPAYLKPALKTIGCAVYDVQKP
jgi:hypothetical protein